MEPSYKVPILRLCSLHISPDEPISPSQLIQSYLGIQLNANYRFMSACFCDTICYIWSRRPNESEDISLKNAAQVKLFKKIIRLLRSEKALHSIADLSQQKYKVEVRYEAPPAGDVIKNIEISAELITAIFNDRIVEKQTSLIRCYRNTLATNLEWHMEEYFKAESSFQLKASTSSPAISEEFSDHAVKFSPGGRLIKRASQGNLHRIMPWGLNQSDQSPPVPLEPVKGLSMDCLDYCRRYWCGIVALNLDYVKLIGVEFLEKPQLGLVMQQEVSRDITFDLVADRLAHDIDRSILRVSTNCFGKELILSKIDVEKDADRVKELLQQLMVGLKLKNTIKTSILDKWDWQVKKEKAHLNSDRLAFAIEGFFNNELDQKNVGEGSLKTLMILMRQRMYAHPMGVIQAALKEIPIVFEKDHSSREIKYQFLDDEAVKFQTSYFASFTQESKKMKELPSFQLKMENIMSASLDNLDAWSSNITIELSLCSGKKEPSSSKKTLEQKICEPLKKLGFTVTII